MMNVQKVKPQLKDKNQQDEKWVMKPPAPEDYDFIYSGRETTRFEDEEGNMVATIIRGEMPRKITAKYYDSIVNGGAIQATNNRGMASGQKPIHNVLKNGLVSKTSRTKKAVMSSIIGFYDRYPRINYCRKTAWVLENELKWDQICDYTKEVDSLYKKYCPREYEAQNEFTRRTSPDFIISGTVFTTVTLNKNFRTHYHRDAGNLEEGYAALTFMKTGKFNGGDLIFPNYRFGVKLNNFDVIVIKNTEIHGNNKIVSTKGSKFERITSVFFYRKGMIYCGTAEEELDRAKRNKGDGIIGPTTEDLNKGRWT